MGIGRKVEGSPGWLRAIAVALLLIIAALLLVVFFIQQTRTQIEIKHWTDLQLVIIRGAAKNSEAWYDFRVNQQNAVPEEVEKEIFDNFISQIEVPNTGDVWIAFPEGVYLHRATPYFNGVAGNSLEDLFRERDLNGGSHASVILSEIKKSSEGTGWYITDSEVGREHVAWTPVNLGGEVAIIGLSTLESRILASSGVEVDLNRNLIFCAIVSGLLGVIFFLLWREHKRVRQHASQLERALQEKSRELEYTNARYKTLIEQITAVTYVTANDIESTLLYMSPQMEKLFGYSRQDWMDSPGLWPRIVHPEDSQRVEAEHTRTLETGEPFCMDYRVYTKAGKMIWIHDESVLAVDPEGVKTWQGVMYDISERKAMEEELRYLGHHDSLTGLYSRAFMETELQRLQKSREFPVSIIMSDVDKLKVINDRYGHAVGDEMLRRAASVIRNAFRAEDIIARMGGDEFAVVLPATDAAAAEQAIERIERAIVKESRAAIGPKLKISFGYATGAQNESLEQVLRKADQNMYHQKQVNNLREENG